MRIFLLGLGVGFALGLACAILLPGPRPGAPRPARSTIPEVRPPLSTDGPDRGSEGGADSAETAGAEIWPENLAAWGGPQILGFLRGLPDLPKASIAKLDYRLLGDVTAIRGRLKSIPHEVIERLLRSDEFVLQCYGADLADLATPPVLPTLLELAEDEVHLVRARAVQALGKLRDPKALPALYLAVRDLAPMVRQSALRALGQMAPEWPEVASAIIASTKDPHAQVRRAAFEVLPEAAPAVGEFALRTLLAEDCKPDLLFPLAEAVVRSGALERALDATTSPEVVTALVLGLSAAIEDEEDFDRVRALRGRFSKLLPLFVPEDSWQCNEFFQLAAIAGESDFLREVALSDKRSLVQRQAALSAAVVIEETRDLGIRLAEQLLLSKETTAAFRQSMVEALGWGENYLDPPIQDLLRKLVRSDPSPWVREAAKELVD